MKKVLVVSLLFLLLFISNLSVFAINMDLPINTETESNEIVENETVNESSTTNTVRRNSSTPSSTVVTNNSEDEVLTLENILSIVLIVIGILLILLGIAIIVRFK